MKISPTIGRAAVPVGRELRPGLLTAKALLLGMGLALLSSPQSSMASDLSTLHPLRASGPTARKINLVFLSEGYRASELSRYTNHARVILDKLLATQPFRDYQQCFNGYAIFVESAESGSDHPARSAFRDTYFNSTYDSYGLARLITIPPNDRDGDYSHGAGRVHALLRQHLPEYDLAIMVVNDPEYGGSGGSPIITSVEASSAEIAVHELGHSYGGLGDEYGDPYPGYPDVEEPNTTRTTDRSSVKWGAWILPTTPLPTPATTTYRNVVGLFEGAHYHDTGWYRPKLDCRMRSLAVGFCEVCAETLILNTHELVGVLDEYSPSNATTLDFGEAETITLTVRPHADSLASLAIQWYTNGVAVQAGSARSLTLSRDGLLPGTNRVSVEIHNQTTKVRADPDNLLQTRVDWTLLGLPLRPALGAELLGKTVVLSWPAHYSDFVLVSSTNLTNNAWEVVPVQPVLTDGRLTLTNGVSMPGQFYRLRRP